jgi:hypothetical protein
MKPTYQKPSASRRGRKKPGRKAGHPGSRRPPPLRVDRRKKHRADRCPDCRSRLKRCQETPARYTEDIPKDLEAEVTEHTIHRDWCPKCKKKVEPRVPDALPKATLGNRTLALYAWLHFALGNTLSQIIEVFNFHLQMKLSEGGLVQMWHRLAEVFYPGNRSDQGADTQAILMSIFRTLRKRGHHPIRTMTSALASYIETGQLPPLPDATEPDG